MIRADPASEQNTRKARRDKRRVPKLTKADIPPIGTLPEVADHPWQMTGRSKQVGRVQCIESGEHQLVRLAPLQYTYRDRQELSYMVFCGRCGELAGFFKEPLTSG